jgi:hypothetical protein
MVCVNRRQQQVPITCCCCCCCCCCRQALLKWLGFLSYTLEQLGMLTHVIEQLLLLLLLPGSSQVAWLPELHPRAAGHAHTCH